MSNSVLELDRHGVSAPAPEPEWRIVSTPALVSAEDEDFIAMVDFLSENWEPHEEDD